MIIMIIIWDSVNNNRTELQYQQLVIDFQN